MANPVKGEVAFDVDGDQYKFVIGTYAKAVIENKTGKPYPKFFEKKLEDWGVKEGLTIFHAGLARHHEMSEAEAADIMDALGEDRVGKIIGEALTLSFPAAKKGDAARPTKEKTSSGESNDS